MKPLRVEGASAILFKCEVLLKGNLGCTAEIKSIEEPH